VLGTFRQDYLVLAFQRRRNVVMKHTVYRLIVVSLALMVLMAGVVPVASAADPDEVLGMAAMRLMSTESVSVGLDLSGGVVEQAGAIGVGVDVAFPDKMKVVVNIDAAGFPVQVGVLRYGTDTYVMYPFSTLWQKLPYKATYAMDPTFLMLALAFMPEQEIQMASEDGKYHLTMPTIGNWQTPNGAVTGGSVDMWVDEATSELTKVVFTQVDMGSGMETMWTIAVSGYDSVTVEEPEAVIF
jgi:hypothetical protein